MFQQKQEGEPVRCKADVARLWIRAFAGASRSDLGSNLDPLTLVDPALTALLKLPQSPSESRGSVLGSLHVIRSPAASLRLSGFAACLSTFPSSPAQSWRDFDCRDFDCRDYDCVGILIK